MAAAILTEDEVTLENIPQVRDIETERKLLASMGAEVELGYGRAQHRTTISCRTLSDPVAKYEIVKTMRASSLVLGPLVARCRHGARGHAGRMRDRRTAHRSAHQGPGKDGRDHHPGARLPGSAAERLRGAHLVFDKITVTGTEDLLMAAVLAEGETLMENCAREPEVTDLAALLTAMGAKIEGAGTSTIACRA
jgi:UDP-N-acetylglucosamine 1-carboxyvinyltransferase